jgi:uncharacterized repeat protein (TIGR04138 family)
MAAQPPADRKILDLAERDPRYSSEAYRFTLDALSYTQEQFRLSGHHGHIDGHQLLLGIREYARKLFGYLGKAVFAEWGVTCTGDFGEIVFNLIEVQLLSKQDSDSKADFEGVFDFEEAFEREYVYPSA